MRFLTDMQGNTMARLSIWHHARKIAFDDFMAHGCRRNELGNYCAKNGPLNGLWYKATMETFQKLIERSRQQCWTEAILSQASQRVPVSNARDWNRPEVSLSVDCRQAAALRSQLGVS